MTSPQLLTDDLEITLHWRIFVNRRMSSDGARIDEEASPIQSIQLVNKGHWRQRSQKPFLAAFTDLNSFR